MRIPMPPQICISQKRIKSLSACAYPAFPISFPGQKQPMWKMHHRRKSVDPPSYAKRVREKSRQPLIEE